MKPVKVWGDALQQGAFCAQKQEKNEEADREGSLIEVSGHALAGVSESKFWGRIRETPEGCWEWQGANNRGYGVVGVRGVHWRVIRLVHVIFHGRLAPGEVVCHSCDNPSCCNPAHLFSGTHADNMQDCSRKGRKGGPRINRKLTIEKVAGIRADYATGAMSHQQLAEKYGAHINSIGAILRGETWVKRQGRPPTKDQAA